MREILLSEYAMRRDVQFPEEWAIAKPNAIALLPKINGFLKDVQDLFPGWIYDPVVESGFRPAEINAKTPGAAKHSLHMIGRAIDLKDIDGSFKLAFKPLEIPAHADLLRKWGLFMEHPGSTPHWVHFDDGDRADRPSRVFIVK